MTRLTTLAALVAALTACEDKGFSLDDTGGGPTDWTVSAHPCTGNRTDTLWVEGQRVWVGCGTTTEGYGLYESADRGDTWDATVTEPGRALATWRVGSVSRSADGLLYVAGTDTGGDGRVASLDTTSSPYRFDLVLESTRQGWNNFQVGTFRRAPSGAAVAESLTGSGVAFRPSDADPWGDGSGWATDGDSYQMLDLTLGLGGFVGAGSTISEPHVVFLPDRSGAPGFHLEPVAPRPTVTGELWGVAADAVGVSAGGVDQSGGVGMVYSSGNDPYAAEDWLAFDVASLLPDEATWIRGVCRADGVIVAVGEYSRLADGIILRSVDGGASFVDITPEALGAVPPVHRCHLDEDGLVVVGADGWVGRLE